jgi:hypothetical protein
VPELAVEDVSLDMCITPWETTEPGIQERLAYIIQLFSEYIAIGHLQRFTSRFKVEGNPTHVSYSMKFCNPFLTLLTSLFYVAMADEICVEGPDHLPTLSPESTGMGHLRVQCRPSHTLAQDIAIHKMPFGLLARKLKGKAPATKDLAKPKQDLPETSTWVPNNRAASPLETSTWAPNNRAASPLLTQNTAPIPENKASEDSAHFRDSVKHSQGAYLVPYYSRVLSHIYSGLNRADLSSLALICIGDETDALIDLFQLSDSVIRRLRILVCMVRNSRWEKELCGQDWGLDKEQARRLSAALLVDITGKKVCNSVLIFRDVLLTRRIRVRLPRTIGRSKQFSRSLSSRRLLR